MKYMIGFPIAWLVTYLMFSFITLTFDFTLWTETYRILYSVFGMVWGVAFSYRISQDCKWAF